MTFPIVHLHRGRFIELPRDHVNSYIVELENSVVIIDATLAVSSARELRQKAEALGKPIEAVLMTHGHPDHYGGLSEFPDLPRIGSRGCLEFALREDVVKAPTASYLLGDDWAAERLFPDEFVQDGQRLVFGGVAFTFHDLGPGESDSDGMWVVDAHGMKHVFSGDSVANRGHCFFRDGHTVEWLGILDRLEREFDPAATLLYVGHGSSPSTAEVIRWQRGYIKTFRDAVARIQDQGRTYDEDVRRELIDTMHGYLPGDTLLFLLDYELDHTVPTLMRQLQPILA
jgi:glyoxylase-like metal-dependent hydrolase (beta-lactamase superfamily II)